MVIAWRTPQPWLAALPLLILGSVFLWSWGAAIHPGMQVGRGPGMFLALGCILALVQPAQVRWSWRSPQPWLVAALVWQVIALAGWAVIREPGLVWVGERAAALLTAAAVAAWVRTQPAERILPLIAWVGAGCLAMAALTEPPWGKPSWFTGPDLPFGNPNFTVGGALPLLALAVPFWRDRVARLALIIGLPAALVLGLGLVSGHATRAVWFGLGSIAGLALILRLPARSHLWLVGLGELAVLTLLALLIVGWVPLPDASPSSGYRLALWRCALDAISQAPWLGTGPASAIVVLQEQFGSPLAWLWVPSYAEHAHHELLNALIDGGIIGTVLLLTGLALTLIPVWRRRNEPVGAGLLLAWAAVLAQASVESHLCQPGPVLLLALLAGATWAYTQEFVVPQVPVGRLAAAIACGAFAVAMISREFNDGGSPTMIEARAASQMATRPAESGAIAEQVRQRLGDLDTWLTVEAVARAKAKEFGPAEQLVMLQLARLPVDDRAFDLALRLRDRRRKIGQPSPQLDAALVQAHSRAVSYLAQVPTNAKNVRRRTALEASFSRL
jgi:O-Antigen ligase